MSMGQCCNKASGSSALNDSQLTTYRLSSKCLICLKGFIYPVVCNFSDFGQLFYFQVREYLKIAHGIIGMKLQIHVESMFK